MLAYLPDSNVFIRYCNQNDPLNPLTRSAVDDLRTQGHYVCIVPQCLYEFYAVVTRPAIARGGLGLSPAQAHTEIERLRNLFVYCPDTPKVYIEWSNLIASYGVSGVNAHDARIVAAMQVQGIPNLLTYNTTDFTRYSSINVIHPQAV